MSHMPSQDQVNFPTVFRRILCLGLVGGYLNAIGFLDLGGLYPAAMTGNTTQLGVAIVELEWSRVLLIGSTVFCFFAGGLLSSLLQRVLVHPALELLLMIMMVSSAQVVRLTMADPMPWELPLLAFTLAMQGETVTRFAGSSLQTVVVTGTLLKIADGLVGRYLKYDDNNRTSLNDVLIAGAAWLAYLGGAGLGVLASLHLAYPFVPSLLALMFLAADVLAGPRWAPKTSGQ